MAPREGAPPHRRREQPLREPAEPRQIDREDVVHRQRHTEHERVDELRHHGAQQARRPAAKGSPAAVPSAGANTAAGASSRYRRLAIAAASRRTATKPSNSSMPSTPTQMNTSPVKRHPVPCSVRNSACAAVGPLHGHFAAAAEHVEQRAVIVDRVAHRLIGRQREEQVSVSSAPHPTAGRSRPAPAPVRYRLCARNERSRACAAADLAALRYRVGHTRSPQPWVQPSGIVAPSDASELHVAPGRRPPRR